MTMYSRRRDPQVPCGIAPVGKASNRDRGPGWSLEEAGEGQDETGQNKRAGPSDVEDDCEGSSSSELRIEGG